MPAKKERILLFRNQGIGDLILISPAVRAIRSLHPESHISIFVGNWSRSAVENSDYIDEIVSYPDKWIQNKNPQRILQLVHRLRKKRFDRVYIFHSHNMLHLLTALAGIHQRYGFTYRGTGKLLSAATEWQPNTARYIADNYLDIPRLAGWEGDDYSLDFILSPEDEETAENLLREHRLQAKRFFVIAPGGGINPRQDVFHKRWGADNYAALLNLMHKEWDSAFVLVGASDEKEICREIERKSGVDVVNLCGEIPFRVSAGLVKKSAMLICNDSSLMHTAVAFQAPSIAIFGPSNPKSLLPPQGVNRYISAGLECSPCYCNSIFKGCDRDLACMKELSPRKVFNAVKDLSIEA